VRSLLWPLATCLLATPLSFAPALRSLLRPRGRYCFRKCVAVRMKIIPKRLGRFGK
jgi:hypothetical protein